MKRVICKSGIQGWQAKLQSVYQNKAEWIEYCSVYNIHLRLGYKNPENAWKANPTVQGSVNSSDFRKAPKERD